MRGPLSGALEGARGLLCGGGARGGAPDAGGKKKGGRGRSSARGSKAQKWRGAEGRAQKSRPAAPQPAPRAEKAPDMPPRGAVEEKYTHGALLSRGILGRGALGGRGGLRGPGHGLFKPPLILPAFWPRVKPFLARPLIFQAFRGHSGGFGPPGPGGRPSARPLPQGAATPRLWRVYP